MVVAKSDDITPCILYTVGTYLGISGVTPECSFIEAVRNPQDPLLFIHSGRNSGDSRQSKQLRVCPLNSGTMLIKLETSPLGFLLERSTGHNRVQPQNPPLPLFPQFSPADAPRTKVPCHLPSVETYHF